MAAACRRKLLWCWALPREGKGLEESVLDVPCCAKLSPGSLAVVQGTGLLLTGLSTLCHRLCLCSVPQAAKLCKNQPRKVKVRPDWGFGTNFVLIWHRLATAQLPDSLLPAVSSCSGAWPAAALSVWVSPDHSSAVSSTVEPSTGPAVPWALGWPVQHLWCCRACPVSQTLSCMPPASCGVPPYSCTTAAIYRRVRGDC